MKMEIKHLAPYLPYELKYKIIGVDDRKYVMDGIYSFNDVYSDDNGECDIIMIKPILRPLSDLPKQNGDDDNYNYLGIVNFAHSFSLDGREVGVLAMPYFFIEELFKEHFDVFGLIEKGLAIDINELKH